jgi:uncharacterized protein YdhG (YjbR/CyaY superfamily)
MHRPWRGLQTCSEAIRKIWRSMNDPRKAPLTIDEYIVTCRSEVRPILERVRETIRRAAPRAEERISYRMPAFFEDRVVVYFAAFKNHIGLFPPVQDESLKPKLAKYAGEKGNLRFPLDEPIPYSLITQVVKARLQENRSRKQLERRSRRQNDRCP